MSLLEEMIALYDEGGSDEEVIKLLRVLPKDFEKKLKNDSEFAALVEAGRAAAKAWWLRLGRKCAATKGTGEYNFWAANMDHRYGWKKTSAVTVEEKEVEDPKELLRKFRSGIGKVGRLSNLAALGEENDGPAATLSTG